MASLISHLPHTLEHNGYSECRHCYVVETHLSLLTHASMPLSHWSFAFSTAVYLINQLPTPTLSITSPYHKLFGVPTNYSKLRSFGCLYCLWLRTYSTHKITPHSTLGVFIGYSPTQSAYLCLDPFSSRVDNSCNVKFVESVYPFTNIQTNISSSSSITLSHWCSMTLPMANTPSSRSDSTPPVVSSSNT